jgi:hypothetical protein
MRIALLLRYPRAERSGWKRRLLDELVTREYDVSVVFAESARWRHLRAAVREYGTGFLDRKRSMEGTPTPLLADLCRERGVAVAHVGDPNGRRAIEALRAAQPDLLVLLGTGIIRQEILRVPRRGTVHCHQGLLPELRGVNTIEWAIHQGLDVHITTHHVDPGVDTGAILKSQQIAIHPGDTIASVRARCQETAADLLVETVDGLRDGTIDPAGQTPGEGRQYFAMHPFFRTVVERILAEGAPPCAPV